MTARTVVIGAGVIGSSIAWHLTAEPGTDVLLLDAQPRPFGATGHSAGILRRHHTLASDTRLAGESLSTFRQWGSVVGGNCGYRPVGFLMILHAGQEKAGRLNAEQAAPFGAEPRWLEADELQTLFPQLAVRDEDVAVLEEDGGYGDPTASALSWQAAFRDRGGRHQVGVSADRLQACRTGGWAVHTNIGVIEADQVVVANGIGAAPLLATAGLELPITPRRIGLAQVPPPEPGTGGRGLPSCIDDVTGTYFAPRDNGLLAVGVRARPECDPRLQVPPLSAEEIDEARARAARRLPGLTGVPTGSQVAADAYTPDRRPVLGPAGDPWPGLHLAVGFSGGGFKIAPAVGAHVCAGVVSGVASAAVRPYRAERFATTGLLSGEHPYAYL